MKPKPFLDRLRVDLARVRLDRLERLQGLTEALSAAATREDVTRIIFDRALALVDARAVTVFWERRPGEVELVHGLGLSDEFVRRFRRIEADEPLPVAEAYRAGEPVWLASREELAKRFPTLVALADREAIQAWAGIPLLSGSSRGALGLQFHEPRAFDEEERRFVLAVVRQCQQALERAQLFDAQRRLLERLQQIHATASALSAATEAHDVAAAAFRALGSLGVCAVEIHLLEGHERVGLAARHGRPAEGPRWVAIDAPTPAAEVVRTGRAMWLESAQAIAERFPQLEEARARREEAGWAVVPLLASGKALGSLAVAFAAARKLEPDDRIFIRLVAQPAAAALERVRLFEDAERSRADAEWIAALLGGTYRAAPVGLALLDRDMRFIRVNGVFGRADGLSPEAHVGKRPEEVLPGISWEQMESAFRAALDGTEHVEREVVGESADEPGVARRWATSWYPVRVRGEVVGVGVVVREPG
jgi:GAF domain-containing protein